MAGLGQAVRHVVGDIGRVLRIVDGGLRHEAVAINRRVGLGGGADLLDHTGPHPPHVVSGLWARTNPRLGSVSPGD